MSAQAAATPLPFGKIISGTFAGLVAGVFGLLLLVALLAERVQTAPSGEGLNTARIPAAYVAWVIRAGSLCAAIPAPVIAGQLQTESGWSAGARNPVSGAAGIAQFLPSTFPAWGRDDDGTGAVSPYNPRDAIMAQGRYDCALAAQAQRLISSGQASGDVTSLALAAYDAGPGRVEAARGIPQIPETVAYVQRIETLAETVYAIPVAGAGGTGSAAGRAAVAAAETALGTPYEWGGSCTDPHGANPAGRCDCSSLVQMAWRAAGAILPRTTFEQVNAGTPVTAVSQLSAGDLIFTPGSDGTAADPGHVGMYTGSNSIVEAPETGELVQIVPLPSWLSSIVAMRHIKLEGTTMTVLADLTTLDGPDENDADTTAEPEEMGLVAWVEEIFAPMIQRRVDLGRGKTWCARWWAHPEVAVRLDALRMAWYEMTAADASGRTGAGYSAWWVNHVDPTLMTLLDGDTGPMSGCRPDHHAEKPVPVLRTEPPHGS